MVLIHVIAAILMIAAVAAFGTNMSLGKLLSLSIVIVLALGFHYWCQQYEP
jgi:hypothetical protein